MRTGERCAVVRVSGGSLLANQRGRPAYGLSFLTMCSPTPMDIRMKKGRSVAARAGEMHAMNGKPSAR